MTNSLLERGNMEAFFTEVISCDEIGISKPHREVYERAKRSASGEIWFVAAHSWDIQGAGEAGLKTVWVGSKEPEYLSVYPPPDATVADLTEASRVLLSAAD
jgi:2-haloacid dehalogenase